jgi:TonB family protein
MGSGVAIPITIQVFKGASVARTEKLNLEQIKIGKIASNSLQLDDDSVSRMHAMIEVSPTKEVVLTDLGSTKGTFVNGQKITKQKLKPGDEVRIGDVKLMVNFEASAEEEISEAAEAELEPSAVAAPAPPRPAAPPFAAPPPIGMPPRVAPPFAAAAPAAAAQAAAPAEPAKFSIPPAYGTKAFLPVVPPHISEQVETRDGSRAVEVAALFEDAVLTVKHFDNPTSGQVSPATKGILAVGFGSIAVMFLLFLHSYIIVSKEKAEFEEWEKHNAALSAMGKDAGKTDKPVVKRESAAKDVAAFGLLGIGAIAMTIGLLRKATEERENEFTIGSDPKATFQPPAGVDLPSQRFPLVRSNGTDYEVLLTAKMTGEMKQGDRTVPLADLMGQARPASELPGAVVLSVPQEARINIHVGESTFNINSVAKPRTYPVPFHIDWHTQSYTIGVFTGVALFMALMFSVPPDPKSLSLDAFMNDQRLAKFLVKPEEQKPEEIPDWLKKAKQENENAGGKRAKETEGKMGKKDSSAKNKIFAIKGPPTNTDIKMAKEAAKDAAKNAGVLGVIRSGMAGSMASIFGRDSALGRDAEDAMGGLVGTEVGDAYGAGGFGLVGSGRGGGGTGEGTIGLGNLGTIGRGSGAPGGGMYGARAGALKARKAGAPEVVPGTAEVRGSLDKELIRRIIRRHLNEVKFCYEKELTRNPNLQGRVMVQFTISPTGSVVASIVQSSTMGNPIVEQCIAAAVRRWEFPKPQGGIVVVTYPFVLKSAGE